MSAGDARDEKLPDGDAVVLSTLSSKPSYAANALLSAAVAYTSGVVGCGEGGEVARSGSRRQWADTEAVDGVDADESREEPRDSRHRPEQPPRGETSRQQQEGK